MPIVGSKAKFLVSKEKKSVTEALNNKSLSLSVLFTRYFIAII